MIYIKNNHFAFELTILHINFILSIFLINYYTLKFKTILLNLILFSFSEISITGGYHRLWSHKSYKASKLLEIFYLFFGTMASQSNVLKWARDHRTHHRCEENDGDPYNINKGFWHAHIWWLFNDYDTLTKDQLIITDKLYMDDLKNNNLLLFQEKYFGELWVFIALIIPTYFCYFWNDMYNGFFFNFIRIFFNLHITWCVNSLAHYTGSKPYKVTLKAVDNLFVSILTFGEGWHNYHHSFPKDYRASPPNVYNPTTNFIDLTYFIGLSSGHIFNKKINNKYEKKNNYVSK